MWYFFVSRVQISASILLPTIRVTDMKWPRFTGKKLPAGFFGWSILPNLLLAPAKWKVPNVIFFKYVVNAVLLLKILNYITLVENDFEVPSMF